MDYRLYRLEDFAALYAVEEVCFQPPFRFSRRYMYNLVVSPWSVTWIAEEETRIAGFAVAEISCGATDPAAYVVTLEVLPEFRRQGAARVLMARIEASAAAAGAGSMWLHVDPANTGAVRLYRSLGFAPRGEEPDFYAVGHHALLFAKSLTPQGLPRE